MANRGKGASVADTPTTNEPEAAPSGLPQYAITVEQFAATHAWRVNERGDAVAAVELMGGFVYLMRQAGRAADTTANYLVDWATFRDS